MVQGDGERTPVYQRIEMMHDNLVAQHLVAGHDDMKDYSNPFKTSMFDVVWIPSRKLMAKVDLKRTRSFESVRKEIHQNLAVFYQKQAAGGTVREEV